MQRRTANRFVGTGDQNLGVWGGQTHTDKQRRRDIPEHRDRQAGGGGWEVEGETRITRQHDPLYIDLQMPDMDICVTRRAV